jgi:hypothetical protein
LVEEIAGAFATFIDRYGRFFRTKTRDCSVAAGRYLHGLAQAQDWVMSQNWPPHRPEVRLPATVSAASM